MGGKSTNGFLKGVAEAETKIKKNTLQIYAHHAHSLSLSLSLTHTHTHTHHTHTHTHTNTTTHTHTYTHKRLRALKNRRVPSNIKLPDSELRGKYTCLFEIQWRLPSKGRRENKIKSKKASQ